MDPDRALLWSTVAVVTTLSLPIFTAGGIKAFLVWYLACLPMWSVCLITWAVRPRWLSDMK